MSKEKESLHNGNGHGFRPFLIGLATGSAAALLLAPKTGAEMRQEIAERGAKARDGATSLAKTASDKATDTYRSLSGKALGVMNGTKESAEVRKEALRHAFEKGWKAYRRELDKAGL